MGGIESLKTPSPPTPKDPHEGHDHPSKEQFFEAASEGLETFFKKLHPEAPEGGGATPQEMMAFSWMIQHFAFDAMAQVASELAKQKLAIPSAPPTAESLRAYG